MGINLSLLALWISAIGGVVTAVLLLAWVATGKRHTALRVLGSIALFITMAGFGYSLFAPA
jgi:hypothetical protein